MFRIGVYHPTALAGPANAFARAARQRFPNVLVATTDFSATPASPAEGVALIAHDGGAPGEAMADWLANLPGKDEARTLLIPLSCGAALALPPAALQHLKGAHWPTEASTVLDRIGVWLGLALLPGAQKIFISYKTSDGEAAAIKLERHLQARGYHVFRDASRDRADGRPNIEPGDDLHSVLADHVRAASAIVLLDTPDAPRSAWIHGEVQIGIGRQIPILPVVFREADDPAEGSRFRRLKELHRFVPAPLQPGGVAMLDESALDRVLRELEGFLLTTAQRRRGCIDGLTREFAKREWVLKGFRDFNHLFEASRRQHVPGQRGTWFFSCCSLEDDVHFASVVRFVQEVKDATAARSYARHIYFHFGDPLYGEDLDFVQHEAIPSVEVRNIDFCHYREAPLKLEGWLANQ
jgi:hypothetical protein